MGMLWRFFFLFANALAFFHELRVYLCTFTPSFLFIFLSFSSFLIFLLLTQHTNEYKMCIKISLRWEGSLITPPISNKIGWKLEYFIIFRCELTKNSEFNCLKWFVTTQRFSHWWSLRSKLPKNWIQNYKKMD